MVQTDASDESLLSDISAAISPGLSPDIESMATDFFMKSFVAEEDSDNTCPGHLDFLPELHSNATEGSCLRHALTAVAYAYLENRDPSARIVIQRPKMRAYSNALRRTNERLCSSQAHLDETLTTIHLMALYEILAPEFGENSWIAHITGILQLLQIRGPDQLRSPTGRQLFDLVLTPVTLKMMRTAEPISTDAIDFVRVLQASHSSCDHLFQDIASGLFFEVAILRTQIEQIVRTKAPGIPPNTLQLKALLDRGKALEELADKEIWRMVPLEWYPDEVSDTSDTKFYMFRNRWIMSHWIKFWTAQLVLRQMIAKLSRVVAAITGVNVDANLALQARSAADDILQSVQFALSGTEKPSSAGLAAPQQRSCVETGAVSGQAIGSLAVAYALEIVCAIDITSTAQKWAASNHLTRIDQVYGIKRKLLG